MVGSYDRKIDTLRISITDRCNLNCFYCKNKNFFHSSKTSILSYEEIFKIVKCFVSLGINKIKLTGGEPLLRKQSVDLIKILLSLHLEDLVLTTNGTLLTGYASQLYGAGLKRINISLDTLKKDKFMFLTGSDRFEDVFEGIKVSLKTGFSPVKLNVVLLKGINDDEIIDFIELGEKYESLIIRFIELMPANSNLKDWKRYFLSRAEVLNEIKKLGKVIPKEKNFTGFGPAEYFEIFEHKVTFGIISPITKPFCSTCNRVRMNCKGELILCLYGASSIDLKYFLRNSSEEDLTSIIRQSVLRKPTGYNFGEVPGSKVAMCEIGG
ncbi:MAG: GTP 3',8-cyclase MoaA [Candidatus Omnitrophica bacterium]|nr:GTP 3',8-cyclase MoaA [Candidatus Omnitrophota bacterium]